LLPVACLALLTSVAFVGGADEARDAVEPVITVDDQAFYSWSEYANSEIFQERGLRCATPTPDIRQMLYGTGDGADMSDCSSNATNPDPIYDPGEPIVIDVVVHIIMNDACSQGVISDPLVQSQIDILNEDFLALTGTNGENGTDAQIHFRLAQTDPNGDPTTGITRDCNTTWFNDGGGYWNSLNWDPNRYMNIYTNTAQGALGYVPFLPADNNGNNVGTPGDRVVILWSAFGRDAPFGPPYDQGRTATHEVGHYLGLEHTFNGQGQCGDASPPGCYGFPGDLICDTPVELNPRFGCATGLESCGSDDPEENYMDYSDDLCMDRFTLEQTRRERCTLQFYRDNLNANGIFADGFEGGDTTPWDGTVD
jgi:hypothetical protein